MLEYDMMLIWLAKSMEQLNEDQVFKEANKRKIKEKMWK
jgi:hypothetical protein